jgi:hypothetical protein
MWRSRTAALAMAIVVATGVLGANEPVVVAQTGADWDRVWDLVPPGL